MLVILCFQEALEAQRGWVTCTGLLSNKKQSKDSDLSVLSLSALGGVA